MDNIKEKLQQYKLNEPHRRKCYALKAWKELQQKSFTFSEALSAIYRAAKGSFSKMDDIIDALTVKDKKFGRTQVYSGANINKVDIVKDENGELNLVGYRDDIEKPLKGQHKPDSNKVFRKSDGQINKNFQKIEQKINDIGAAVRELFPNESKVFITQAIKTIREFAANRKINTDKVINRLKRGIYELDDDLWKIKPKAQNESKTIYITKKLYEDISRDLKMTEYKFYSNINYFIQHLLADPVNTDIPYLFKIYNFNRSYIIRLLVDNGILNRKERISDRDENGNPKTATMMETFEWPKFHSKKDYYRKLKKLYIKLFEKNLPPRKKKDGINKEINEDGAAGGAMGAGATGGESAFAGGATGAENSGSFVTGMSPVIKRKMPSEIKETASTTNVGDYTYDVPFLGDKESLARKNGVNGSVSVNEV